MRPLEQMGKFATVVIDPPWDSGGYQKGNLHVDHDYVVMSLEDIKAIPIARVLESDSWLFLWTTSGMLPHAFDVLKAFGVAYMFTMSWAKPNGPKPTGYPTYNCEYILVGKRGKPQFIESVDFWLSNQWEAVRNSKPSTKAWGRQIIASSKPQGFYDLLCRVTPGPRLDVFGRRTIKGFDSWGDEAPNDNQENDRPQDRGNSRG